MTMTTTTGTLRARRRLGGAALVVAPLLLLAGALVHPREVPDAGDQLRIAAGALNRWYVAHLLYVAATVAFVPAVLSLGRRLRDRAPGFELWGTGLAVVGLFCTAGLVAIEGFGGWQLAQLGDRQAATQAFDHLIHSAGIVVPFAILGLALSVGLVVLAVGLHRASAAAPWVSSTLGAGAVLLAVGLAGAFHPAFLAGVVGVAAAMVGVGVDDLGLAAPSAAVGVRAGGPLVTGG
jgi:hypothetical protein